MASLFKRVPKVLAVIIGLVALLLLASSGSEILFEATPEKAHLYPFGSERVDSFFYQSLNHYRLRLAIDIVTVITAVVGAVNIWRQRKLGWLLSLPFWLWIVFVVVSARYIE